MKEDIIPGNEVISRDPFPASRKIYVPGRLHPIRVAMREISVGDTVDGYTQSVTHNPAVTVYDTSGPFTDPAVDIDIRKGLPRLREAWVEERLKTADFLEIIIAQSGVPVVVNAGIGAPSDAAWAMEMGADAVLMNTAIAASGDPVRMAKAFKLAVESGRMAFEARLPVAGDGMIARAVGTSALTAFLD